MSNKLQLRRRISRLLTGEDNFTIKDIIIRRINPATGETMFWGTLRQGRNTDNIKKYSNHEQDSTQKENQ
jgi:hypothetical protein